MIKNESYEFASLLNVFAFRQYNEMRVSDQNMLISPAQVMISLSMLGMGCDGITESEVKKVLGYGDPQRLGECVSIGMKELFHSLRTCSATQIKVEKTIQILGSYVETLKRCGLEYDKLFESVDFVRGSQVIIHQVNKSAGFEVIPKSTLNSFVRVIVVNTISFECLFASPFPEKLDTMETFVVNNPSTNHKVTLIETLMMNQIHFYKYFDDKIATFVSIPLKDYKFHLDIIVPKIHIQEYESIFNLSAWTQYILSSTPTNLHLKLPLFALSKTTTLKNILQQMGIQQLFNNFQCDLSKMDRSKSANISQFFSASQFDISQANRNVEQSLEITKSSKSPILLTVNRPFVFIVRETHTNSILLFGKIIDPSLSS